MYPSRLSALRLGLSLVTLLALAGCDEDDPESGETGETAECGSGGTGETGETVCAGFAISATAPAIVAGESVEVTVTGATGTTAIGMFRGSLSDGQLAAGDGPTLSATFAPTLADPFTLVATDEAGCSASVDVLVSPGPAESLSSEVGAEEYDEASGELVRRGTVRILDAYGNPLPLDSEELILESVPRGMTLDTSESTEDTFVLRASTRDEWVTGEVAVRYGEWTDTLDLGLVPQEIRVGEAGGGEDAPGVEEGSSAFFYPTLYVPEGQEPVYGWSTTFVVTGARASDIYVSERPSESRGCSWEWSLADLGADGVEVTVSGLCEEPFAAGMHQPVELEIVAVAAGQLIELAETLLDLAGEAWEWWDAPVREEPVESLGKATKMVPISLWYEGDTDAAVAQRHLEDAQRILRANSRRCTCPRFYVLLPTYHAMPDKAFDAMVGPKPPDTLTGPEMDAIAVGPTNHDAGNINAYFAILDYPFEADGVRYPTVSGLSVPGNPDSATAGAVFVHRELGRATTLAHELLHKGSAGRVLDSPYDNGRVPQGANEPGNLFNYANEGEDITVTQCGLFDENLP